jgi:hypothetical protein
VSSNLAHDDVYSMQHYLIKFVSDSWQIGGFRRILRFPPPIKQTPRYIWNMVESDVKHHNLTLIQPTPLVYYNTNSLDIVNLAEVTDWFVIMLRELLLQCANSGCSTPSEKNKNIVKLWHCWVKCYTYILYSLYHVLSGFFHSFILT